MFVPRLKREARKIHLANWPEITVNRKLKTKVFSFVQSVDCVQIHW